MMSNQKLPLSWTYYIKTHTETVRGMHVSAGIMEIDCKVQTGYLKEASFRHQKPAGNYILQSNCKQQRCVL